MYLLNSFFRIVPHSNKNKGKYEDSNYQKIKNWSPWKYLTRYVYQGCSQVPGENESFGRQRFGRGSEQQLHVSLRKRKNLLRLVKTSFCRFQSSIGLKCSFVEFVIVQWGSVAQDGRDTAAPPLQTFPRFRIINRGYINLFYCYYIPDFKVK